MRAVIFDMDGVIVDSELHWKEVESEFLAGLIGHWDEQLQAGIIGMSAYDVYRKLVAEHGLKISIDEYRDYYNSLSVQIYGEKSALIPGSRESIESVSAAGFQLALASSSPRAWIDIVLNRFSLLPFFNVVTSSDDVGGIGKPHPAIYEFTSTRLAVSPSRTVAIEDTKKGIQSAKSAGMRVIGFRNGFNEGQDLSAADHIIEGFAGLQLDLIHSLVGDTE